MTEPISDPAQIQRTPLQDAVWLPPTLLRRNPWNRTRFAPDALAELTANVKKIGIMQPLVARAIEGATVGQPLYEIVAGERRWLAATAAQLSHVPVWVKALSDVEVIEMMTIENGQRESLHPLDEANNYHELLQRYDIETLKDRINRSKSHIYQRLKLRDLCEAGQAAMLGNPPLNPSTAVDIARIASAADQAEATAYIMQGFGGEPLSVRSAREYIAKTFMLRLEKAPFDVTATFEVAGPCGACHKRTGAHAGLFDDVGTADMCQDRQCFEAKTEEQHQATLQAARDAGHKVVGGDEARALLPSPTGSPVAHQFFDKPCPAFTDSKKPLRELLGLNFKGVVVLDHPTTETAIAIVPDDKVKKALKAKGLLREEPKRAQPPAAAPAAPADKAHPTLKPPALKPPAPKPPAPKPLTEAQFKQAKLEMAGDLFGTMLFKRLHACMTRGELPVLGMRLALGEMLLNASYEGMRLIYQANAWEDVLSETHLYEDMRRRIGQADARLLGELMIQAAICEELTNGTPLSEMHEGSALQLAEEYGLDVDAINQEAEQQAEEKLQAEQVRRGAPAPAATPEAAFAAAAPAPASTGGKATVKYRNAATGDSWSGRGLKPRWLVAALEAGKQLADFEVSA